MGTASNILSNVPEGYALAPLDLGGSGAQQVVNICLLVKLQPDAAGGALVTIRQTLDARVLLGAISDSAGRVHEWVEVWVQNLEGLAQAPAAVREALEKATLSARWEQMVSAYEHAEKPLLVRTGFEDKDAPETSIESPGSPGGKLRINPGGSRLMIRTFSPHGLEQFAGLLGSPAVSGARPRVGVAHGRNVIDLDKSFGLSALDGAGLFLGQGGRYGRIIESLHLKLRLFADCLDAVRNFTQRSQRPILNLRPESFQVRLAGEARGLPQWWTARAVLADPGDAAALPVSTADVSSYLSASASKPSVYRPEALGLTGGSGKGQVRIRTVLTQRADQTVVEGTLNTSDRVRMGRNDLLWLRTSVADKRIDLYAMSEHDAALASGELRFRTLGQTLAPGAAEALTAAQGVPLSDVGFEIVPMLSTPVDLYALGVIAVRLLLCGKDAALPVVLDETLSLASQASQFEGPAGQTSHERVSGVVRTDKRWLEALGPQRLTDDALSSAEALGIVPPDVWFRVLGMIVSMFPGLGPSCPAKDLGDARSGGLHLVFDQAAADVEDLLRRTRSLIVIDWNANREIHAAVRRFSVGLSAGAGKR